MSGGYFQYQQYRIEDIAVGIDEMIGSNDDQSLDEWGQRRGNSYPPEILEKFQETAHTLRQAAEMAQRVDWLASGDDGEDSFMRRWDKEVRPYWASELNKPMENIQETDTPAVKLMGAATIRRNEYPKEYAGWNVEHDSAKWTSDYLGAAPVPLECLMDELNKVAERHANIWAVVYPQNA